MMPLRRGVKCVCGGVCVSLHLLSIEYIRAGNSAFVRTFIDKIHYPAS